MDPRATRIRRPESKTTGAPRPDGYRPPAGRPECGSARRNSFVKGRLRSNLAGAALLFCAGCAAVGGPTARVVPTSSPAAGSQQATGVTNLLTQAALETAVETAIDAALIRTETKLDTALSAAVSTAFESHKTTTAGRDVQQDSWTSRLLALGYPAVAVGTCVAAWLHGRRRGRSQSGDGTQRRQAAKGGKHHAANADR